MLYYQPESAEDLSAYYELRWRLLRKPWNQPPGSEKDEFEQQAFHLLVRDKQGAAIGVGRIHCVEAKTVESHTWQVRYMGVVDEYRNQGIGSGILHRLESFAQANGAKQILLNARENALGFYLKRDYQIVGDGPTLYGSVKHKQMCKVI